MTYAVSLISTAETIKAAANQKLFDGSIGLYWDNTTTAGHQLYPQDGNPYAVRCNSTSNLSQARQVSQGLALRLGIFGASAPELPRAISPFVSGHEIEAHSAANPTSSTSAMNLIRRQWGCMQNFSKSTHIDGYSTDGTLNYAFYPTASFISHTHAWSTGLMASLILHILGISQETSTTSWSFAPQYIGSGLFSCAGDFRAGNASYGAAWTVNTNGTFSAQLNISATTNGKLMFPMIALSKTPNLYLDGSLKSIVSRVDDWLELSNVPPGNCTILLQ